MPVMAAAGTLAVVAVLAGLQCGGIDRCFVAEVSVASAAIEPTAAAEEPVVEERLVADKVIAAAPAAQPATAPVVDPRARQIANLIGGSFEAIRADDEGWLAGAYAPAEVVASEVEEGDGPGPVVTAEADTATVVAKRVSGDEAVAAIAALEQPVKPIERPKPLAVTAFAEEPAEVAPKVKAAAEKQLADVAAKAAPAKKTVEPPVEEPAKVAAVESGDTRTVTGSGANVRSGPGKSNKSLFALVGGEKVKVGENQRGWLKITDDQGRTGWIYKSYLN